MDCLLCGSFSSAVAGAAASLLTNPFEVAKLRFQIQQSPLLTTTTAAELVLKTEAPAAVTVLYRGLFHAMWHIHHTLGWQGLFRGAWTRILFHTPNTALTMTLFEECKQLMMKVCI